MITNKKIAGVLIVAGLVWGRAHSQPNVVFILADDLGWAQTSAYGSHYYQTPHLGRLAAEGIRFTNAYSAAAICSPTRAAIMTGKYPARLHLTDYIPGDKQANQPLKIPQWQQFLPLEETTLAEVFRSKGYTTALFGKWHLSPEKFGPAAIPFYPDKQGFEEFFVIDKPDKNDDPEADPHKSDSIGNRSVAFLKAHAGKPFFLFASFSAIHNPLMDQADAISRWKQAPGAGKPENNPVIAAMLSRMDRNIGKILQALDELNLADNTIVIFHSDNGGLQSDASQSPLRAGKGRLYEGGIRVPLIVRWPGTAGKGTVCHETVASYDFMPTFCDLLAIGRPENTDGVSILPLLQGKPSLPPRDHYWHYPHYHSTGMAPGGAIRRGSWKLVENYEKSLTGQMASAYELYDLENDEGETVNLAAKEAKLALELAAALKKWREETRAQMPVRKDP